MGELESIVELRPPESVLGEVVRGATLVVRLPAVARELDDETQIFFGTIDLAAGGPQPRAVAVRASEVKAIAAGDTAVDHLGEHVLGLVELAQIRQHRAEQQRGDRGGLVPAERTGTRDHLPEKR